MIRSMRTIFQSSRARGMASSTVCNPIGATQAQLTAYVSRCQDSLPTCRSYGYIIWPWKVSHFQYCLQRPSQVTFPCSWASRVRAILRATRTHAVNLATFVALYKSAILLQRKLNSGKSRRLDTFVAGLIGGYIVFGDRNAINEQVSTAAYDRATSEIQTGRIICGVQSSCHFITTRIPTTQ
jgi:hypothetical protein